MIKSFDLSLQPLVVRFKTQQFRTFFSFHKDAEHAFRKLHHLFDRGNSSYLIHVKQTRYFRIRVFLSHKKYFLVMQHRLFHSFYRTTPADIKVYDHIWQNRGPAKGDRRQNSDQFTHVFPPDVCPITVQQRNGYYVCTSFSSVQAVSGLPPVRRFVERLGRGAGSPCTSTGCAFFSTASLVMRHS